MSHLRIDLYTINCLTLAAFDHIFRDHNQTMFAKEERISIFTGDEQFLIVTSSICLTMYRMFFYGIVAMFCKWLIRI